MLNTQNQNDARFNRHHLFFTRDSYRGEFERSFRDHEGLVIPVLVSAHQDLHNLIPPPPKPTREMMKDCIDVLDQDLTVLEINPFYALNAVINYLDLYKALVDEPEKAAHAQMIRSHLGYQAVILSNSTLVEVRQNEQREQSGTSININDEMQSLANEGLYLELLEMSYSDRLEKIQSN